LLPKRCWAGWPVAPPVGTRSRSPATPIERAASVTLSTTARAATQPAPARLARVCVAAILDAYVEEQVLTALQAEDGLLAQAVTASEQIDAAARSVAEAEHELDLFVNNPRLLSLLGEEKFLEGVEVRQRALDEVRAALAEARSQSALAEELGDGDLLQAWPSLTVQERRRLMHGLLERVIVTRADRRGRHARPIGGRSQVVLRGGSTLGASGKKRAKTVWGALTRSSGWEADLERRVVLPSR
jgi:hypothetical protein